MMMRVGIERASRHHLNLPQTSIAKLARHDGADPLETRLVLFSPTPVQRRLRLTQDIPADPNSTTRLSG